MKRPGFFIFLILGILFGSLAHSGVPYRGATAIDFLLRSRVLTPSFNGSIVQEAIPQSLRSLLDQGTTPNPTNFLLWSLFANYFGIEVAKVCKEPSQKERFLPDFGSLVLRLCTEVNEHELYNLWLSLMSFDAPYEEFEAWRDFANSEYLAHPGKDFFKTSVPAILLNPYFLLEDR